MKHIEDAAAFVLDVTRGKTLVDYSGDRLLRQAIERNLEIIGEAVGRLARDEPQTAAKIDGFRQIIAFRNVLIHGYDVLDHARIWQVIAADLPRLKSQVDVLLTTRLGTECEGPENSEKP